MQIGSVKSVAHVCTFPQVCSLPLKWAVKVECGAHFKHSTRTTTITAAIADTLHRIIIKLCMQYYHYIDANKQPT